MAAAASLRRTLAEELGLDPSPELSDLEQRILRQDPALLGPLRPVLNQQHVSAVAPAPGTPPPVEESPAGSASVGRGEVLGDLDQVVAAAVAGRGRLLVLEAPAGLGKSTTLQELTDRFRAAGGLVLRAGGQDSGAMPALWPWVTIVRELVRENGSSGDAYAPGLALLPHGDGTAAEGPLSRTALYRGVVDLLGSAPADRPVAVVIDDLHGVDADTLTLLGLAVAELAPAGALFAVGLRPDELGSPAARDVLARIRRDLVTRIGLRPLTVADVTQLLGALSGVPADPDVAAAVHERSAGNPFFAVELIRLLTSQHRLDRAGVYDALPGEVLEVLRRRLDRLPELTQSLLSLIALVTGPADVELLAEVTGVDPEAVLDGCEAAVLVGLLRDDVDSAGGFELSHDLVRRTLDRGLGGARRIRLHAKIGAALRRRDPVGPEQVVEVARHLTVAAPVVGPAAAIPYLIAASEDALSRYAHEQAERDLLTALELAGRISDPAQREHEEGQLLGRLALVRVWFGGRATRDARPAGGTPPRPLSQMTVFFLLLRADAWAATGAPARARELVQEARAVTARTGEVCLSPRLRDFAESVLPTI